MGLKNCFGEECAGFIVPFFSILVFPDPLKLFVLNSLELDITCDGSVRIAC